MDRLQAMEVFVRVVDTGAFTRAAEVLHMPKATVTTLVQNLESHLGAKLLQRTTRRVSVTPDSSLVARRVGMVEFVTCAAPAYLERHGIPAHPHDLMHHRCVNYFSSKTGRIMGWDFTRDGERIDLQLDGAVALNDGEAYFEAGLSGLGVVQVAAFMVKDEIARGKLARVLADWEIEPLPVWIMYPQNRHLSAKVRVFVEWIADLFSAREALHNRPATAHAKRREALPA